jgi:hypothetical protein
MSCILHFNLLVYLNCSSPGALASICLNGKTGKILYTLLHGHGTNKHLLTDEGLLFRLHVIYKCLIDLKNLIFVKGLVRCLSI